MGASQGWSTNATGACGRLRSRPSQARTARVLPSAPRTGTCSRPSAISSTSTSARRARRDDGPARSEKAQGFDPRHARQRSRAGARGRQPHDLPERPHRHTHPGAAPRRDRREPRAQDRTRCQTVAHQRNTSALLQLPPDEESDLPHPPLVPRPREVPGGPSRAMCTTATRVTSPVDDKPLLHGPQSTRPGQGKRRLQTRVEGLRECE
jgi:hypothetical protein